MSRGKVAKHTSPKTHHCVLTFRETWTEHCHCLLRKAKYTALVMANYFYADSKVHYV